MIGRVKDLTGQRFGRLTVLYLLPERKNKKAVWKCRCDCGNETSVVGYRLTTGVTQSCGCYQTECMRKNGARSATHGNSKSRLYKMWQSMKGRCNNQNNPKYPMYGARGISVCEEWLDFGNFFQWAMNNGYDPDAPKNACTIDRIDNDKGYFPENCRFADACVQDNNRRNNTTIFFNGESHTIAEWSRITGISKYKISYRYRQHCSPDKIFKEVY